MSELQDRARAGEDVPIDYASIEQTLAELWRVETSDEHAVTRAALWNVVAHTASPQAHTQTSETLGRVAASVPQRTIVIRADPQSAPEMTSWISANCHLVGEGKQVCSEEIAIVAGGNRVTRVPPLVNALLIPDMPVAMWWVGDLPHENAAYVRELLEPADRLIVDSSHFDSADDLELVQSIATSTTTAPADLNWVRLEQWRAAAASIFDPPAMRERLRELRRIRIVADASDVAYFGESVEALLFASWVITQAGCDMDRVEFALELRPASRRGLVRADLEIGRDTATIERDMEKIALMTRFSGQETLADGVTRSSAHDTHELVVRELKSSTSDRLLAKILPRTIAMARRAGR